MIATAIQRGNQVYVYGADGNVMTTIPGELKSYTGDTVSIQRGKHIYVSNGKGQNVRTFPV